MIKPRYIDEIYLEDNNGGDYLQIEKLNHDLPTWGAGGSYRLKIGRQCVVIFNQTGTPSEIIAQLHRLILLDDTIAADDYLHTDDEVAF